MYWSIPVKPRSLEDCIKEFKNGDWSALLECLTRYKIDDTQLRAFGLSRILESSEILESSDILKPSEIPEPSNDRARRTALVLALLWSGVDPDKYLPNAVGFFAEHGNTAVLRLLLDFGANPNGTPGKNGSPLSRAAKAGQTAAIDILLRTAKISPIGEILRECLHAAINAKQVTAAARLLADPRVDLGGIMGYAISVSHVELVRLLLKDPRIDLESMLYRAVRTGDLAIVSELIRSGRFRKVLNLPIEAGQTALDMAREREFEDIANLLRTAGAGSS